MLNYLQEIIDFSNWKDTQPMTPGAIALWYELMSLCNRTGWQEEFSPIHGLLMARTGLSSKQLQRARDLLVKYGRIRYQKAEHSSECGKYKIIPFVSKKGDKKNNVGFYKREQTEPKTSHACPPTGTQNSLTGTSITTKQEASVASETGNTEDNVPNNKYKQNQTKKKQN